MNTSVTSKSSPNSDALALISIAGVEFCCSQFSLCGCNIPQRNIADGNWLVEWIQNVVKAYQQDHLCSKGLAPQDCEKGSRSCKCTHWICLPETFNALIVNAFPIIMLPCPGPRPWRISGHQCFFTTFIRAHPWRKTLIPHCFFKGSKNSSCSVVVRCHHINRYPRIPIHPTMDDDLPLDEFMIAVNVPWTIRVRYSVFTSTNCAPNALFHRQRAHMVHWVPHTPSLDPN